MCGGYVSGNRALFGQSGAVAPLVSYLTTSDLEVHRSTSVALFQLSKDPWNCVTMHQNGVVPHLLRLIGKRNNEKYEFSHMGGIVLHSLYCLYCIDVKPQARKTRKFRKPPPTVSKTSESWRSLAKSFATNK